MTEPVKDFYEGFTSHLARDLIYPNARHAWIRRYVDALFDSEKITSALDVGTGVGITARALKKRGARVTALDLSEANITLATESLKGVKFVCADFLTFESNERFDLLTLFDVFEHFPHEIRPRVFERISDFSHDRTLVVLTTPTPEQTDWLRATNPDSLQIVDEKVDLDDVLRLAAAIGFTLKKYERFGVDYREQYQCILLGRASTCPPQPLPKLGVRAAATWHLASLFNRVRQRRVQRRSGSR